MRFKVGDIVECIDTMNMSGGNLTVGKCYEVKGTKSSLLDIIDDDGKLYQFAERRFTLANNTLSTLNQLVKAAAASSQGHYPTPSTKPFRGFGAMPTESKPIDSRIICPKCKSPDDVVFIDHGPVVGKGYFCRHCKDDVQHTDNVYGITAKQLLSGPKAPDAKVAPNGARYTATQLECNLPACKNCATQSGTPRRYLHAVAIKVGDVVECNQGTGLHIKAGKLYRVAEVLQYTIRIDCMNKAGKYEPREYTRCRFSKAVKIP